jgi:hypothetical protein
MDYMTTFRDWSHTIGFQFSNQPAYNFNLDVAASAAIPDAPEIESLGVPTIDQARQLTGGVHLGKHTIFSSETGARFGASYALRMSELLVDALTQYSGGVNMVVLHGFSYSGTYPNTTYVAIFISSFLRMNGS